jgi:hypothetical protein
MIAPFAGSLTGRIRAVAGASIHGDVYYDVQLELEGVAAQPGMVAVLPVRLPQHAVPTDPTATEARPSLRPGRRVEVTFLMQQPTGVRFLDA